MLESTSNTDVSESETSFERAARVETKTVPGELPETEGESEFRSFDNVIAVSQAKTTIISDNRILVSEIGIYLATIFLISLILFVVLGTEFSLQFPLAYSKDGLFTGIAIKSIIDNGWYLTNQYLGSPGTYQLLDYPLSDTFSFLIIKTLTLVSSNYAVIMNLFYLLTFYLVGLAALVTFRKLQIKKSFSIVASLLFTFLPYHFMRGEYHLFLSAYFAVPIYLWMVFAVFNNEKMNPYKNILYSLLVVLAASTGIYYAFFACYFLLIAGLLASFTQRLRAPLIKSFFAIVIISLTCFANMAPNLIYTSTAGKNYQVAKRHARESEEVGLKIAQMVLPVDGHRIKPLRKLKEHYNRSALAVNENRSATLGLIGTLGFLILLGILVFRSNSQVSRAGAEIKTKLFNLACLTFSGVLLGTVGGLGTLFAYTISPSIRSYNRISVFIAFFAIAAFFLKLQYFLEKRKQTSRILMVLIAATVLIVGLYDQIGYGFKPNYAEINKNFLADQQFVEKIEGSLPTGAKVFQLPVTRFPENSVVNQMDDYELFRGYLHSHNLHWSYGAVAGREAYGWQKEVASLPLKDFIRKLKEAGFSGIYINRKGYQNHAVQLEKKLSDLLKQKPITSGEIDLIFFDLGS